jgi:CzcA family heavy metal efflux pump
MLNWLVSHALRFRGVVVALACLIVAYGIYVTTKTRLDVFPEFASPQIVVQTEAPGLSAEQVEALVTRPVESALNGTPGLQSIRSESIQGLSAVTIVFRDDADVFRIRQMVSERLVEVAGQLPRGAKSPKMGPLTSSTSLVLAFGLTSSNRTPMELRTFADWTLRPQLLGVPGVGKVDVFGGEVRQLQIQVKPERLIAHGVSLDDVLAAARESTGVRGAGFLENANQRVVIRSEGQSLTPHQLSEIVVSQKDGLSVRLKDVAHVTEGAEPKFGDAQIMGERGVILLVHSQYGANTLEVTAAVESMLEDFNAAFHAGNIQLHPRLFRPATFIETSLGNIRFSLVLGGALVVIVLFLFLLDLRTALISFTAIPLSLLAAVIVLHRFGVSINTNTLGGFAIAIGVVVDDAIIDVENILRRLRQNLAALNPRPLFRVVLDASLEVRGAVVYATFIVALVFLPVLAMSGVSGRIFSPLAVAFILSTLASLLVALTVTPALCLILLSGVKPHEEPRYVAALKRLHRRWLESISRHPRSVIASAFLMVAVAVATVPFFGGEFLPEFKEGHFVLHMALVPGTSLEESLRLGREVTAELLKNPHIRSVAEQAGRAEQGEDVWGPYLSEFHVDLAALSGEEGAKVANEIRGALMKFPGAMFKIMPFLVERMEETMSGATAQVVVNIFGNDLDTLDRKAEDIRRVMAGVHGAVDVLMESKATSPELMVRLRPERLVQFGYRPVEVLEAIEAAYEGVEVAQTFEGNRVFDVTVILAEPHRRDIESIGGLMMRNRTGLRMPLRELAEVYLTDSRTLIAHEGVQRRQQVTCNVDGRDVASFVRELKEKIAAGVSMPSGVYLRYGGSAEAQKKARIELLMHSAIAGVLIVLLLAVVFHTGRNLMLVLANVPFALVGGALAVFASGALLSIGSLVGFVTLFGLTMRNSIMLVSHYEHLVREENMAWGTEAAIRGASERLVPILMTGLVTALGLLPLAVGAEQAGHEIEGPMAIVILGGLITSTALNLLVLPALALRFARFERNAIPETMG